MYCTYFSQNPLRQLVLDPRVCTGFKSVWVESVVGLVLVGLKIIFNGFRLSWEDENICMGLVEVWFSFETILTFTGGLPGKSEMLVSFRVCQPVTLSDHPGH